MTWSDHVFLNTTFRYDGVVLNPTKTYVLFFIVANILAIYTDGHGVGLQWNQFFME